MVQTLEKSVRIAHLEGKNWKQDLELYKFLHQYRATPHSTTSVSPSEALNNRKLKTTIPELPLKQQQLSMPQGPSASIAQRDAMQKQKMKIYADLKAHAHEREIEPGEVVLMRQPKKNKLTTPYNPKPFVVEEKKGSMVTASNGSQTVIRNSSQFKVIPKNIAESQENREKKDEEKTLGMGQNPPETKEDIALRRSIRGRSNLLSDSQTMYKSFMSNRVEQATCLILLFIFKEVDIWKLFSSKKELSDEH